MRRVYSEPKAYSEPWYIQKPRHIQNTAIDLYPTFCQNSYLTHFLNQSSKHLIKIRSKKSSYIFLYFRKWNLMGLILKNFLYFLKRKLFLYFGKRRLQKKILLFRKWNFLIFQKMEIPKNIYISGSNFPR